MNEFIDAKFYEKYIKEIPIEEQIKRSVRAECYYMDKADIYGWITQDEIKIMNLQSKIDKANEILNRPQFEHDNIPCNCEEDIKELKDILKEDK